MTPARPSSAPAGVPGLLVLFATFVLLAVLIESVMIALSDWAMLVLAMTFLIGSAIFLCAAVVHVIDGGHDVERPASAPAVTPARAPVAARDTHAARRRRAAQRPVARV